MTPNELVSKWQHILDQCNHIPTWTENWNLAYCAEIASQSGNMVEFGSYIGASAKVMLVANPNLHLWCVDIFTAFVFNREVCSYFLRDEIRSSRCELITGDSQRALEMLPHMLGKIDAVFVDDGHAKEDVERDIKCALPLLRSGGLLFGHDWDGDNDVAQGVKSSLSSWDIPVPRLWAYRKP